jgi:hypothetical protein
MFHNRTETEVFEFIHTIITHITAVIFMEAIPLCLLLQYVYNINMQLTSYLCNI